MYRSLHHMDSSSRGRHRIPAEKDPKYQTAPFTRTPGLTTIEYRTSRTPKSSAKKLNSSYSRELEPVPERNSEQSQFQRGTGSFRKEESFRSGSQDQDPTMRQMNFQRERDTKARTSSYQGRPSYEDTEPHRFAKIEVDSRARNERSNEKREIAYGGSADKKDQVQMQRERPPYDANQENPTLKSLSDYTFHARGGTGNTFETEQSNTVNNSTQLISRRTALFGGTERQSDTKWQRNDTLDSKDRDYPAKPQTQTGFFRALDFQAESDRKARTMGNGFGLEHEEPYQIINSDDPQILRSYAKRLLEKLQSKEELLEQMRQFHNEVWESYEMAQREIMRLKANDETGNSEFIKEIEALKISISELDRQNFGLSKDQEGVMRERDMLRAREATHVNAIEKLTADNENLRRELRERVKEADNQIEGLVQQIRKLEAANRSLSAENLDLSSKIQNFEKRRGIEEEGELAALKKLEEENALAIKALAIENDTLQMKNAQLRAIIAGYTKSGQPPKNLNQSMNVSKQERPSADIDGNVTMFDDNSRNISHDDYSRNKLRRFKERINELESEVINLKLELKSRPTLRQYKQNELRVRRLESDLERQRSLSIDAGKPKDADHYKNLLMEIQSQIHAGSFNEIIPRIRHLYTEIKILSKFSDAVSDMIVKCSPAGFFETKPNLKQAWRFLKGIMQEFGAAKKQAAIGRAYEELILDIEGLLGVGEFGEIRPRLKKLIQENNRMESLILEYEHRLIAKAAIRGQK